MRLRPQTRRKLALLSVINVVTLLVVAVNYLGVLSALGIGVYDVRLDLPATGGLHAASVVTYEGVEVGKVTSLSVDGAGRVTADLQIREAARIPRDVTAAVHEMSPVGEQYVDLTATLGDTSAYLRDGSVIAARRVRLPVSAPQMFDQVDRLLQSLPKHSLQTLMAQMYAATRDIGAPAGQLLASSVELQDAASHNVGNTVGLIDALVPVLATQRATGPQILGSLHDLGTFTGQLRTSDPAFRRLLSASRPLAKEVDATIGDLRPLPQTLADSATVTNVLSTYRPNLEDMLTTFPAVLSGMLNLLSWIPGDPWGYLKEDLKTPLNNPPPCTTGFPAGAHERDPNDLSPGPVPKDSYCKLPHSDPRVVRGVRNMPCPHAPLVRGPKASSCGYRFPWFSARGPSQRAVDAGDPALRRSGGPSGTWARAAAPDVGALAHAVVADLTLLSWGVLR